MSMQPSGPPTVGESLLFVGGLGCMAFLGIIAIPLLGALSGAPLPDNDFKKEAPGSFHSAPRVPGQYPLMQSPYLGTLAGMCWKCGSGGMVIGQNPFFSSSTRACCCGMSAHGGFGWGARRSQWGRLQAMADGELFDLMEEIVQESKRRQSERSDSAR
ncbi:hypothetical protein PV04_02942 [Phialophora macrospora]|uniref:Uncharacterized protein n=1 Tax=Phialophora macrospora TaxID=1851006 RepID=A0A0D2E8Q8_9EURO|nr:hypothetical protein PV04_02942 [Phialophora macrospora]